ncbi:DUF6950 family protein [Loktanella gaetbuli]|uniref:DUF6950 family protein n=1 Tax=Loktanella gaetbuli TaxID=2881335 RepID=UPI00384BD812
MVTAAAYVAATGSLPWIWGQNDCAMWAAGYVAQVTGVDPASSLRGTYSTAFACRRVQMRAGGLLTLSRSLMSQFPRGTGDGVAVARVNGQTIAGIIADHRLWLKARAGVTSPARFEILDRWSVCPKH